MNVLVRREAFIQVVGDSDWAQKKQSRYCTEPAENRALHSALAGSVSHAALNTEQQYWKKIREIESSNMLRMMSNSGLQVNGFSERKQAVETKHKPFSNPVILRTIDASTGEALGIECNVPSSLLAA